MTEEKEWDAFYYSGLEEKVGYAIAPDARSIDDIEIQKRVSGVAAALQMKNLEADTIPYLAHEATARLRMILLGAVRGREHRDTAHHLAPQPLRLLKRKREEDPVEILPLWEEDILQDAGKVIETLADAETQEERNARKERLDRDAKEKNDASTPAVPNTKDGQPAQKKKKEGPTLSARNTSEAVQKKMADITALRSVGLLGKTSKYSWLSGGQGSWADSTPKSNVSSASGSPAPSKDGLPPPRFTPNLPPPRFQNVIQGETSISSVSGVPPAPPPKLPPPPACLYGEQDTVMIEDILWSLEHEKLPSFRSWPTSCKKPGKTEIVSRWRWGVGR